MRIREIITLEVNEDMVLDVILKEPHKAPIDALCINGAKMTIGEWIAMRDWFQVYYDAHLDSVGGDPIPRSSLIINEDVTSLDSFPAVTCGHAPLGSTTAKEVIAKLEQEKDDYISEHLRMLKRVAELEKKNHELKQWKRAAEEIHEKQGIGPIDE